MGFNINNQTGGVVNNVEGNQYIRGGQHSGMVQAGALRAAVQELERGVAASNVSGSQLAAMSGHLKEIDQEISRAHPEPDKVAGPLRKLTEIASAAGALAGLAGPIQSLITWLGPLGQPIVKLLSGI
ncbi:hypothetical protein FBY31_1828 [Arthrobacter sp. SLBN-100]|uniref:hypothetical protein n=1 Tax=Arthrobacter sp. SLBN-100 TaxID=2768450 RepID=UPI0011513123|nr:hypothetical protein [Arthrobacter sp. SLBN-100]TQJ67750.1 hypothetical protein FBY31_1828 [Arthrobacter sp. SLBN-100]